MLLDVDHDAIARVDAAIFTVTFTPDCMTHTCRCRGEGDRVRPDACCQHGCDVLLTEKDAILRRTAEIAAVLRPFLRDLGRWFDERDPEPDHELGPGAVVRVAIVDPDDESSGCVFLQHTVDDRGEAPLMPSTA